MTLATPRARDRRLRSPPMAATRGRRAHGPGGRFAPSAPAPGRYAVMAAAPGGATATLALEVAAAETVPVETTLDEEQP